MILKILGWLLIVKYGVSFVRFLWFMLRLYVLPSLGMRANLKKYGEWAVITGATDGIGKAIAKQLAKRGFNLVIVSRSEDKLTAVANELESEKVKVKTIQFDFSLPNGYDKISKELNDLDIGLLVNNVGLSYDHPDKFLFYPEEEYDKLVHVNITSVLKMTRIVLKGMEERKRGLIVHTCSGSVVSPCPYLTVYGAAKNFVQYFGEALGLEYKNPRIKNQVVIPFYVATKMSKLRPSPPMIPSPEAYAKSMVNSLGLATTTTGYWAHELMKVVTMNLPSFIVNHFTYNHMVSIQKKWHKKQQQKKE